MNKKLNIGAIGLGRLGQVYATDLAHRVPNANLIAVADLNVELAKKFAEEYNIPNWYKSHQELLANKKIDAVAVITSSSTHKEVVIDAAKAGKAVFCEKPISIALDDAKEMMQVVEKNGAFFQMGFQRRFDRGYLEAKKKIDAGVIGTPVLIISTSRDPFRPPLEFCNPKVSGGLIADMGAHDFDVCRMFMGEVQSVYSVAGTLAYPEMKDVGDIDNAIINMYFENETIGTVNLSRNAVFGYDIRAEIWGTNGSLQVGYYRETPILVMTKGSVAHDTVPHFMQRFELAYLAQIKDFVKNVLEEKAPSITGYDAIAALKISLAANQSYRENRIVRVSEIQ
ncbi:Gfo/Idh/MocA family oxidoreductase [candidate division KSB1 bacterium]|nr:Gfo/Idh/MocA family oxidoreductase [candidate division KSB1 bacterium]